MRIATPGGREGDGSPAYFRCLVILDTAFRVDVQFAYGGDTPERGPWLTQRLPRPARRRRRWAVHAEGQAPAASYRSERLNRPAVRHHDGHSAGTMGIRDLTDDGCSYAAILAIAPPSARP